MPGALDIPYASGHQAVSVPLAFTCFLLLSDLVLIVHITVIAASKRISILLKALLQLRLLPYSLFGLLNLFIPAPALLSNDACRLEFW